MQEGYSRPLAARLTAIEELDRASRGLGDAEAIQAAGLALEKEAAGIRSEEARLAYADFGILLQKFAFLARWATAVRNADVNPERFLVAAKQGVRDLERRGAPPCTATVLETGREAMLPVVTVEEVERAAKRVLCTVLPWPDWGDVPSRSPSAPAEGARISQPQEGPVAFLKFRINGQSVPEPHIIQPGVLYDLELEATFSRWPEGVECIRFSPLHVEPVGVVSAPVFEFRAPPAPRGERHSLIVTGRFQVSVPQDFLARPLEIAYAASSDGSEKERASLGGSVLSVQGQRRLVIQSFDPRLNPVTGVAAVDVRLLEVRQEVRRHGLRDFEIANFLTLLGGAGKVAFKSLADNVYLGKWTEARFQVDVRSRLRDDPRIGSELEEHPAAAGGIADLSFHKVRLELKVDDSGGITTTTAAERFGQQLAQYVAGSDRRAGVLVVLDSAPKEAAPHSLENDISITSVPPASGERAILIGVIVVRGNLSRPSSLSR
jgi:hypothetical protein